MSTLTAEMINEWVEKPDTVALHLKQKLLPVEGEGAVIFPPTYADIGYNIDTLSDGTKVCTIDSVGSQANRMEPIFKESPFVALVPQIEIELYTDGDHTEKRSLLDLAHRSADAVVHSSPTLMQLAVDAFQALRRRNNAMPLCCFAPTSLVFGAWDSRGGSGEKRPRLVRAVVRAEGVDQVSAAAQFNSVWKHLSDEQKTELEKEAKSKKVKLSEKGFADAPSTFRKVSASAAKHMPDFKNNSPNPERRTLGGIYVSGHIERDVTINLVALRALQGASDSESQQIRRYLLALALIAGLADLDLFLRSGCQLQIPNEQDELRIIPRRGAPSTISISSAAEIDALVRYASDAVEPFKAKWPQQLIHKFDIKEAKRLLAKKDEDESEEG